MGKVREFTGAKDQKRASREANAVAQEAGQDSIGFQREALADLRRDLAPFRELGQQGVGLSGFLTDPNQQADFVRTNPLFQAALENVNKATMNAAAARGKLGSGGTLQALTNNYMATAMPFISDQKQSINNLLSIGQNAAARSGNAGLQTAQNTGNILQDMANMAGASAINQGNIMAQSRQDLLSNFANGGLMGALSGGALTPTSNMGASMLGIIGGLCDERLKDNKVALYVDDDGLVVYEFTYKGDSQKYEGKMAQDIQEIDPDSVYEGDDGYLRVSPKYAPKLKQEVS